MTSPRAGLVLGASLALLASCGGDKKASEGGAAAGGQILDRSVTDDMLPYDTVRSRRPLLAPEAGQTGSGAAIAAGGTAADAEGEAAGAQGAAEAPAEEADTVTPGAE
ncbi:hypothetical protein [Novosphingobium sp. PC22D]|uniref:hypothetical protein n=1 Tax=Novosphingobium sp. PC22D TaxID=1962403 RepID=UPI000BEFBFEC|nr:hypothetical protein [Novosphingobium sp. PC22D]